jgi:hypothetical protein
MLSVLHRSTRPRVLALVSLALVPISLFVPLRGGPQVAGILCWTGLCTACVLRERMLLWAILCIGMLAGMAFGYWVSAPLSENPFSARLELIEPFIVAAFVTAGTGVFSVVRTAALPSQVRRID